MKQISNKISPSHHGIAPCTDLWLYPTAQLYHCLCLQPFVLHMYTCVKIRLRVYVAEKVVFTRRNLLAEIRFL